MINQFNSSEKILNYIDKMDAFLNRGRTLIVTELDLTNKCNNLCPGCTGIKEDGDELSWEEIKRIVDGLKALKNEGVIISGGGEPLLHPKFAETIELMRYAGMSIGVNSNGLALDRRKAIQIAKHCKYFRISLDAGSPEMYEKTHGVGKHAFEKVLSNITMMANIKKELDSELSFGVGFLTGEHTIEEMEKFVHLVKELGADFAQFRPFTGDTSKIMDRYTLLKERYETENFKVTASLQKYNHFDDGVHKPYDKCRGMFFSTVITANARMYACLHHRQNKDYLIGDMRETQKSLPEIWDSYRKYYVYETMNVHKCPLICRNDSFNRTLSMLDMDIFHSEFL